MSCRYIWFIEALVPPTKKHGCAKIEERRLPCEKEEDDGKCITEEEREEELKDFLLLFSLTKNLRAGASSLDFHQVVSP